jgi:hypothetical protein
MSMQSPAPIEADERLKKQSGTEQSANSAGDRAPVDAPSATTRPQTREEQMQAYKEWHKAQPKVDMSDAERAERADQHLKNASTLGTLSRAKTMQKAMDENREDGTDIYAEETREMIHRKDQAALSQSGSTSGDRLAQGVSNVGEALHTGIKDHGGAFKAVDELAGGPVLQTAEALGLAMHAQGTISAKKDATRQDTARRTRLEASQAHDEGSAALASMRESKTAEGGFEKGRARAAFAASARTVMAHNKARRAALAAGQETMKPMSVDHTVGEATPIALEDGTKIDSTLGDQARAYKDARKEELTTQETGLKDTAQKRTGTFFTKAAPEPEWQDHLAENEEERKSLTSENTALDKSAGKRWKFAQISPKGYKYGLLQHEADEYHPARDAFEGANKSIADKHADHVKDLESSLTALNATGMQQKQADRHRGGSTSYFSKQKFSKKPHLEAAQREVTDLRNEQTKNISTKIAGLKAKQESAKKSGNTVEHQRIQDEIDHHNGLLAQSQDASSSFVSTQYLSKESQSRLHSSMDRVSKLQREKDTGLTEAQQAQHDHLRATLDAAKSNPDAGAHASDLETRDKHKDTVEHYRFVKQHGMTPDEHDTHLANAERILELKKEKSTGLSTEDQKKLDDIGKERTGMKGLVKRSRAFAKKHDGETVVHGRVGGVGTEYRADRAETSASDARAATINEGAKTAHRVGEVMEANLEKGRDAMSSGDHEHARNIAVSRLGQNVADTALIAAGGQAIGTTVQNTGKIVQAGSDIVGGLTHEGADRAQFAKNARAMTEGADGKTDQWRKVHDSVMDFHGAEDVPFAGGVKKGARSLLNMGRQEFGGDIKGFASDTVTNSSLTNKIADTTADVAKPVAATVAPVLHSVVDETAPLVKPLGDAAHSLVKTVTPVVDEVAKQAHHGVDQVGDASHSLLDKAKDSANSAVDHIPEMGVNTGAGDLVHSAGDQMTSHLDDATTTAHEAINQHIGALPTQAHEAISENIDGLPDKAHQAITDNIEGLPGNLHDSVIDKAGSTAEDSVDTAFDKADEALTDAPKKPEVIGKPVGPRKSAKAQPTSLTVQGGGDPVVAKVPSPVVPTQPEPTIESARQVTEKLPDPQAVTQPHPASPSPARPLTWWDHVKNFGKRMWKGVKGFFGR